MIIIRFSCTYHATCTSPSFSPRDTDKTRTTKKQRHESYKSVSMLMCGCLQQVHRSKPPVSDCICTVSLPYYEEVDSCDNPSVVAEKEAARAAAEEGRAGEGGMETVILYVSMLLITTRHRQKEKQKPSYLQKDLGNSFRNTTDRSRVDQ